MAAFGSVQVGVDVLRTTRDEETKTILAQIGDVEAEEVDADNAEWWQHCGFVSRPQVAEPKKQACQVVLLRETGNDVCIASRDVRGQAIAGALKDGETCVYGGGADGKSQGRSLYKQDGSVSHVTTVGNTADGATLGMFIQTSGNIDTIAKDACLMLRPSAIRLFSPTVSVSLSGDDCQVFATGNVHMNGSTIVLGGAGAKPTANQDTISAIIEVLKTALTAIGGKADAAPGAPAGAAAATAAGTALDALVAAMATMKTRNE